MKAKMQSTLKAAEALHQSVETLTHVDAETGEELKPPPGLTRTQVTTH